MPNTKILKENGQEFYPVTHASLIVGMENQGRMDAIYAWDGTGTPDITKIPAGVVVTYDGTDYTGTLAASADTAGRFYLVPSTTVTGEYDRYLTDATGSTITWKPAGTTAIPTPSILDNVTSTDTDKALSANQGKLLKDEVSQLQQKVAADISLLEAKVDGDTIDYTRLATGGPLDLTPPILPGYTLVSITGANINSVLLYDENGESETVSLPYMADKKFTRWAVYASGSPEITLHTQFVSKFQGIENRLTTLETDVNPFKTVEIPKLHIYQPNQSPDYENDICECYVKNLPAGNVTLKSYNNAVYLYTKGVTAVLAYLESPSQNNIAYPIKVRNTNDTTNYPVGTIVGYVMFRDVAHFLANSTGTTEPLIYRDRAENIHYSPNIQAQIYGQDVDAQLDALNDDVEGLQGAIASITQEQSFTIENFVSGYTGTQSKNIGDSFTPVSSTTPVSAQSTAGQLVIPVNKGDNVTVKMKSVSNQYCMAYVFLDENYKILSWAGKTSQTFDWRTNPHVFSVENDGFLVLQFTQADYTENVNAPLSVVRSYISIPGGGVDETIEIALPSQINAIVGDTLQLYYRSIFRCVDFSKYAVKVVCNIGAQYPRYYEVTPLAGNVGTHPLSFTIKDNNNNTLGTKTVNLVVVPAGTNPASELNVLCLGASATQGGQWASEFKRRLVGTGGTPAGSGKTNIQFVGRKNVTFDGKQVNLEATGGYSFPSYTNTDTARYRFNVTAENEPTINVGDVYSNNGNNYTVKEINITAGEGGYFSCEGTGAPQSSGTLTKVSGSGSETIAYSSTSFSGNPFVYNGAINMQQYADDYCNPQGASHGRIDVVYTELFGNGTSVYMNDFTTRLSQMQTFINQVRAVFPNCKFCIGLFWNPDIRGGMGVNYGATGGWSDPYGIKYSNMNLCNALQKYITDNNLSDYVFILNWLNEFDEENDMNQTTKPVNVRSSVTEIFGVNGVHPATVGYYQMADTAWRLFVAKFCQS